MCNGAQQLTCVILTDAAYTDKYVLNMILWYVLNTLCSAQHLGGAQYLSAPHFFLKHHLAPSIEDISSADLISPHS